MTSALLGQTVFAVDGADYSWEDVVLAAVLRGDWCDLVNCVRSGLACVDHATRIGVTVDADDGVLAAEFRYARGLLGAAETRAWLARWDVSPCAWMEYVRRARLRELLWGGIAGSGAADRVGDPAVAGALMCEGACSGWLLRLARRLAARVALWADPDADASATADAETNELGARLRGALRTATLPPIDLTTSDERVRRVARAELALRRVRERIVTPRATSAQIASRRLEWTKIEYRALGFADPAEAAEAALCAREDRESLRQVATVCGRPLLERSAFLDETDPATRDRLVGAAEGQVVGPVRCGDEFVLFEILAKRAATPADADVTRRAERLLVARALRRAMDDRVRWADWR